MGIFIEDPPPNFMVGGGNLEAKGDLHIDYLWFAGAFGNQKEPPSSS